MEYGEEKKKFKYNQNLYKIYKMISADLLFYYAICYLFLAQEKGLSTAQILFADAFYPLFKLILQIPSTILIEKLGKRKSLILANSSLAVYILIVMGLSSTLGYIISNIFCAIGFTIKGVAESNLLYDSIENNENKRIIFSKIDGFSSSLYYYFNAITAVASGFLFVINPYIPMILCLIFNVLSAVLSHLFKEMPVSTNNIENEEHNHNPHKHLPFTKQLDFYFKDLKQAFKFITKSNRLRALILFNAVLISFTSIISTLRRSVLSELNIPNAYFGIIFAIYDLTAGFSSNSAAKIQKNFGNQTLSFLGLFYCISVTLAGLVAILVGLPTFLVYFFVLTFFTGHSIITGPYSTLIKQYLGSFSTSSMRTKITSANLLIENISRTLISFIASYLTDNISSALATLILGILFTIIILFVLSYMKSRVGLKPEEYPSSDIKFNEIY